MRKLKSLLLVAGIMFSLPALSGQVTDAVEKSFTKRPDIKDCAAQISYATAFTYGRPISPASNDPFIKRYILVSCLTANKSVVAALAVLRDAGQEERQSPAYAPVLNFIQTSMEPPAEDAAFNRIAQAAKQEMLAYQKPAKLAEYAHMVIAGNAFGDSVAIKAGTLLIKKEAGLRNRLPAIERSGNKVALAVKREGGE